MREKNSPTGLNQLLKILSDNQIDFVIIGGFACVVYGSALVTRDLDVCAVLTPETIQKLREIFASYHPKHRMTPQKLSFLEEPRSLAGINNLYLDTDLGMVDFLSEVKGLGDFQRLKEDAETVQIFGRSVRVLSLDDLILAKEQMNRPKDKMAAEELKSIRSKQANPRSVLHFWFGDIQETPAYMRERTKRWFMGGSSLDKEVSDRFQSLLDLLTANKCEGWSVDPLSRLAAIIVLDQFSRNIFRGTPRAFAQDATALELARQTISQQEEGELHPVQRLFLYLPFEHAENLELQELSVGYYRKLLLDAPKNLTQDFEENLAYAISHRDIIQRFGRFPHRNHVLNRPSTIEEIEFLKTPGSSF